MEYSNEEYCDMLLIYGECGQRSEFAAREYARRFPHRRAPYPRVFTRLINRARQTGSLMSNRKDIGAGRNYEAYTIQNEEAVLACFDQDPCTSIRTISRTLNLSRSTVQRILKTNTMHAYHYTKVQNLWPQDYIRRVNFCTWFLEQEEVEPGFVHKIMFTDESLFTREGIFNIHNYHVWANENPYVTMPRNFQRRFTINLWAGIFNNRIIGPFELPARVNNAVYHNFLMLELPELMEKIPLDQRREMIFQHDGAPFHNAIIVRHLLDRVFPEKWIGRGGPQTWPPRSPDLTPMDYFFWGHIKEYIYRNPINDREELEGRIIEAIASITPEMIRNAGTNLIRRAHLCIELGGGHFEHML